MNDLRDIVEVVDGYSIDRTGFEVTRAAKNRGVWEIGVRAYRKEGENFTCEDPVSIVTLINRIENPYSSSENKWRVLRIEDLCDGNFGISLIRRIEVEETEDEEKDSKEE